jgi:glycosyltransferase involved in cell wall biosynthesis
MIIKAGDKGRESQSIDKRIFNWKFFKRCIKYVLVTIWDALRLVGRSIRLLRQGNFYLFFYRINQRASRIPVVGGWCNYFENLMYRRTMSKFEPAPRSRIVNILVPSFFDLEGGEMYCGGGERYLIELNRIIQKLGYEAAVYQDAAGSWVRWYNDLCVQGIPSSGDQNLLNREFHHRVAPEALTIYFAFSLAFPFAHPNSLGISHGIWWDQAVYQTSQRRSSFLRKTILDAFRNCRHVVSVDTNTINWVRTMDSPQSDKMTYIPNFVELGAFAPAPKRIGKNLVILYPRRLYTPRGFWLVAELIPYFCERYDNVNFHFVGKGDPRELAKVGELVQQYPGRVRHYHYEPEDMHKAYRAADITLIPTVASEGTSLSCIEAMASGNAVISTEVGGLTDLIINEYNGLLISPKTEDLARAIEKLITDPQLRQRLQRNAREVSKSFALESWSARWEEYLSDLLPARDARRNYSSKWIFFHPTAPCVTWERAKQRPQHLMEAFSEYGYHSFFASDSGLSQRAESRCVEENPFLHVIKTDNDAYLTNPVIYVYYAYMYEKLEQWPKRRVIYDILDDPAIHAEDDRRVGRQPNNDYRYYHEIMLEEAEIVITSSEKLYRQYYAKRPDILLIPNAVKVEDFAEGDFARPADLPPHDKKTIGYYGAIAEWFDFELMECVAKNRPEYNFVLIGLTNCPEKIERLVAQNPNVYYLGEKPYEQLPSYLAHFDAAIIPFVVNDVTNAVSPVKLFEYMAGGKPTVATDIYECRKYPFVQIAKDGEQFASQLDLAITLAEGENYKKELRECALANTWKARAGVILEALEALESVDSSRATPQAGVDKLAAAS